MARINITPLEELTGKEKEAYEDLKAKGKLTNMKGYMLQDIGVFEAFMGWYPAWESLVKTVGQKDAVILAHAVSTTNSCLLCSLFFISDLKALGLDPASLELDEKEELLVALGQQIVKDPTKVTDEQIDALRKYFTDKEIIIIVGFAAQMMATNNFNSVLRVEVDHRLLPIKDEFKPATWRENIK